MTLSEPLIAELNHEANSTKKMLERLPKDSLMWRPHERSRSVGEIASHIANIPSLFIASVKPDEYNRESFVPATKDNVLEIMSAFDKNVLAAIETLRDLSDEQLLRPWRYRYGEQIIFEMPKLAVIRAMGINHLIHHRGQLSVYLRLLNVPLPPIYGQTADE